MIINMNISICKSISITKLLSFDVYLYVISTFRIYINSHLSHIYLVRRDPEWVGVLQPIVITSILALY